ncbi:MAG: hypothetical protein PHX30_05960 [Candidatus Pacebacteria bacterium]|nr:hypothetical protein [Candidatus Paceibacterota bacterium]
MTGEYNFFLISAVTLGAYGISWFLVKKKSLTLFQHRKIWNIVLLVSFLVSGVFGMLITFLIDSGIRVSFYPNILRLHVELGVVMALASSIHLLWHKQYYWNVKKVGVHKGIDKSPKS